VWFEIDVTKGGEYDVELAYDCPAEDAGSKIRLNVGAASQETTVAAAPIQDISLPHRDEIGKERYRNRQWATLKLGTVKLPRGPARLTLEALTMPGTQVLDLKHVQLKLR
jgi:arylsulfatase A